MNNDSVSVELVVAAAQMDADRIWMQGDLEIRFNMEKPCNDGDIVDVDAFLQSLEADGEYAIFSCCCGVPSCSGWIKGIRAEHAGEFILWTNLNNGKTWRFSKQKAIDDLKVLREEVQNYKTFFARKEIEYVGVGYNWENSERF
jgi:hypothetical protein